VEEVDIERVGKELEFIELGHVDRSSGTELRHDHLRLRAA
jgi:hypothetical protein